LDPLSPSSITVSFVAHGAYLEANLCGLASLAGAESALEKTAAEARRLGAIRILLDCLGILGQTAPYDHRLLGQSLARHLAGRRCALVTAPAKLLGVMGTAAVEAGMDYRAFVDLEHAKAWLCE
jgi:hypothetical protein